MLETRSKNVEILFCSTHQPEFDPKLTLKRKWNESTALSLPISFCVRSAASFSRQSRTTSLTIIDYITWIYFRYISNVRWRSAFLTTHVSRVTGSTHCNGLLNRSDQCSSKSREPPQGTLSNQSNECSSYHLRAIAVAKVSLANKSIFLNVKWRQHPSCSCFNSNRCGTLYIHAAKLGIQMTEASHLSWRLWCRFIVIWINWKSIEITLNRLKSGQSQSIHILRYPAWLDELTILDNSRNNEIWTRIKFACLSSNAVVQ